MDDRMIYTVVFDGQANRRATVAMMRRQWFTWLRSIFSYVLIGALVSMFFFHVAYLQAQSSGLGAGLGTAAALGVMYVLLYYLSYIQKALENAAKGQGVSRWTCEFTEDRYVFTDERGCQTAIPWDVMRIDQTTPDAYLVKYGSSAVLIYRKPLQDSGYEDEFVRRAGGGGTP